MDRIFVRTASAIGIAWFAVLIVGLTPFLTAGPSAGAGLAGKTPQVAVNRSLKGDRLPIAISGVSRPQLSGSPAGHDEVQSRPRSEQPPRIPVGCEAAFSSIASPLLAHVYRRCMT
jgi:hypothetical protein